MRSAQRFLGLSYRAALSTFVGLAFALTPVSIAIAETLVASDRNWSEAQGWTVYWNAQDEGCFAEQLQDSGTRILLGIFGSGNRLAVGFRNAKLAFVKKDKNYDLTFRFDGHASWTSGMFHFDSGGGPFLLGVYDNAAKFRAEFAKSGKLTIQQGKRTLAVISLKGSNAAFKAVDDCRKAMRTGAGDSTVAGKADGQALAEANKLVHVSWSGDSLGSHGAGLVIHLGDSDTEDEDHGPSICTDHAG